MILPDDQARSLLRRHGIALDRAGEGKAGAFPLSLAVAVDRDRGCYALSLSTRGNGAANRVPVDPGLGPLPFMSRRLVDGLAVPPALHPRLGEMAIRLHAAALVEDAERIALDLRLDASGITGDVAVELDNRARYRHAEWHPGLLEPEGSAFERAIARAGGVAAEIDPAGRIVGVISGAGLMMATLDLLIAEGAPVRAVIDLGGAPLQGADGMRPVVDAVSRLEPAITFFNAFFHTADADDLAASLLACYRATPLGGRVVIRLAGRNAPSGRERLAPLGFPLYEDLEEAVRAVVALARELR